MTITLKLTPEQEHCLRIGVAQQDAQAVREILLQAVDSTVEDLLRSASHKLKEPTLPALLDKIAAELRDAPALSDEAVSRAEIYADHFTDRGMLARRLLGTGRKFSPDRDAVSELMAERAAEEQN